MRVLVLGAGKMGRIAAEDLIAADEVSKVGIVDPFLPSLTAAQARMGLAQSGSEKFATYPISVADRVRMAELMQEFDVVLATLPTRALSYAAWQCALSVRRPLVDILEEYHRRPDNEETEGLEVPAGMTYEEFGEQLHEAARAQDLIMLDGIGFAPGLSNITLQAAMDRLDRADEAIARVGGIPNEAARANHPLGYMITWRFDHVLREYMAPARVIQDGIQTDVEALSGYELFSIPVGDSRKELECAITPGMPSFPYTRPTLRTFAEKTIRWPGHWAGIETLKQCGMLSLDAIQHAEDGYEGLITPRAVLASVMEPRLRPGSGEGDLCVMWNTIRGSKAGAPVTISQALWEENDSSRDWSAMARVTAHPAAVATIMVGSGRFTERGVVAPEECIRGELYREFMDRLNMFGVRITEEETIG